LWHMLLNSGWIRVSRHCREFLTSGGGIGAMYAPSCLDCSTRRFYKIHFVSTHVHDLKMQG
jgi:hypothetical protein